MSQFASIRPITFTTEKVRLIIASRWYARKAHFDLEANRHRECAGENCAFCRSSSPPHPLFYAVGELPDGSLRLVCLRKRHAELVHVMQLQHEDGLGQEIVAYKKGTAKNSPIEVELGGVWEVEFVDADAFMQTVLLPAITKKPTTLRDSTPPLQDRREAAR